MVAAGVVVLERVNAIEERCPTADDRHLSRHHEHDEVTQGIAR